MGQPISYSLTGPYASYSHYTTSLPSYDKKKAMIEYCDSVTKTDGYREFINTHIDQVLIRGNTLLLTGPVFNDVYAYKQYIDYVLVTYHDDYFYMNEIEKNVSHEKRFLFQIENPIDYDILYYTLERILQLYIPFHDIKIIDMNLYTLGGIRIDTREENVKMLKMLKEFIKSDTRLISFEIECLYSDMETIDFLKSLHGHESLEKVNIVRLNDKPSEPCLDACIDLLKDSKLEDLKIWQSTSLSEYGPYNKTIEMIGLMNINRKKNGSGPYKDDDVFSNVFRYNVEIDEFIQAVSEFDYMLDDIPFGLTINTKNSEKIEESMILKLLKFMDDNEHQVCELEIKYCDVDREFLDEVGRMAHKSGNIQLLNINHCDTLDIDDIEMFSDYFDVECNIIELVIAGGRYLDINALPKEEEMRLFNIYCDMIKRSNIKKFSEGSLGGERIQALRELCAVPVEKRLGKVPSRAKNAFKSFKYI